MSMTDPIADMLTRIRNACGSKHRRVDMPVSKMKTEIARILKENNFIQDYRELETENGRQVLRVVLKYAQGGQPVIRELQARVDARAPQVRRRRRDSARAQRPRHGDPQHVAGADVRPRRRGRRAPAASSSPSSGKGDTTMSRIGKHPVAGPERRHGDARRATRSR